MVSESDIYLASSNVFAATVTDSLDLCIHAIQLCSISALRSSRGKGAAPPIHIEINLNRKEDSPLRFYVDLGKS